MRAATRLSSLIRTRLPLPAMRAGIPPTWDRPDPPASQPYVQKHRVAIV